MSNLLQDELTNDPMGIGYKNQDGGWKSDEEIVALLMDKVIDSVGSVLISDVLIWAGKFGAFSSLKNHRNDPDPIGNICETALAMFGSTESLSLGNSDVMTMLIGLVQAGVISSEAKNALVEKATVKVNRLQQIGLESVSVDQVAKCVR